MARALQMKKIAIFDVDNVLINGQSQEEFLKFLLRKRVISRLFFFNLAIKLFLYKIYLIRDISSVRLEAYKFFENKNVSEMEKYFDDFFQSHLKKKINPRVSEILCRFKSEGCVVILISASLYGLVSRLGN